MTGTKKKYPGGKGVEQIYREQRDPLRYFIRKQVGSDEDAEDILHDVFYNLAKIDLLESPIEKVSAWLYKVAGNKIIDRRRKKKVERLPLSTVGDSEDELMCDISSMIASLDDDPEKEYLKSIVWEELAASLYELPPEQRTVFELTELQGFSFKEIAQSTGVPLNTLISRKRYAVLFLRERLNIVYSEFISED